MSKTNQFEASYYEHLCSVVCDQDVLYIDIKNKAFLANFRRWWQNLFLLSYSDTRSRSFYLSSHSMRIERAKQFRYYNDCIHPFSRFRNWWDIIFMCVIFTNRIIFIHNSSVIYTTLNVYIHYIALLLEFLMVVDIVINMKTGYIDQTDRKIVLDPFLIIINYFTTKVFRHAFSSIPYNTILFLKYGAKPDCPLCKSNLFVCTLKLLSILGAYRMFEASELWTREQKRFKRTAFFKFLRIFLLGSASILEINSLHEVITLLLCFNGQLEKNSRYIILLEWSLSDTNCSRWHIFFLEWSNTVKSLMLFAYILRYDLTIVDKMTALLCFIIANFFYFWILAECIKFFGYLNYSGERMLMAKEMTMNLLKNRQIPDSVTKKVTMYYKYNCTKSYIVERDNKLYTALLKSLKDEIKLNSYARLIQRIPYFTEWPRDVIQDITLMLTEEIYLAGETVSHVWAPGEGLSVLDAGMLAVYTDQNTEVGHLIDGDFFGELSLVTDKELRASSVVAVNNCQVLTLDKADFRLYMRAHPTLFFSLKAQLFLKYQPRASSIRDSIVIGTD